MRLLLSVGMAGGLVLLWSGLQAGGSAWERRINPYVAGLGGRVPTAGGGGLPLFESCARLLPKGGPSLSRRLASAGSPLSIEGFRYEQGVWSLVGAFAGAAVAGWAVTSGGSDALALAPVTVALGGFSGYAARDLRLTRSVAQRRARVVADLPLACDLLTLSIMAGEAVPAAFERVAAALPGDVGSAFRECVGDIRAGANTVEALQRLPEILPGPAVGRLADSLCVGIERGAPLADTLRAQCDDLRDSRRRGLMESGGRKEILMLVPVVFLILPVVVTFALYPGLVALELLVA